MKNYRKSDYALNKNRKGIVYRNADGSTLEITFEKIAEGNPEFTYEDFEKLKAFSDEIYLEQVKAENNHSYYVKGSFDEVSDSAWLATPSLEELLFYEKTELPTIEEVKDAADICLTQIQKRRFKLRLEGLSTVKIAEIEGCSQTAVWKSIDYSVKKIKQILAAEGGRSSNFSHKVKGKFNGMVK